MKNSKFLMLIKKDLMNIKTESLFLLGFIIVGNLFFMYRFNKADGEFRKVLYTFLSGGVIMSMYLFIAIRAFNMVSNEWKNDTLYLIKPLPIASYKIFLSKIITISIQFIIGGIISMGFLSYFINGIIQFNEVQIGLSSINLHGQSIYQILSNFSVDIIKMSIMQFLDFLVIINIIFFSSVVGRMLTKKLAGLVSFSIFVASYAAVSFTSFFISYIFRNEIMQSDLIRSTNYGMQFNMDIEFISTPLFVITSLIAISLSLIFFAFTSFIYEKKVEL